jgi:2-polyprenyl-6-methoxyphenol hydroxylase-like FAD-dependent oxidoreductase
LCHRLDRRLVDPLASDHSAIEAAEQRGLLAVHPESISFRHEKRRPPGDWRDYFADLGQSITELLSQAGQAYGSPIVEVDQPYAFLGRTVLVGDAAHAMSPAMGQGVGLAVEDALVLTETLNSLPVEAVLAAYEERRAPRIAWVREQSHRRDGTRSLAPDVRDRVRRLAGRRMTGRPLPAIP